jgi:hypothetical protein
MLCADAGEASPARSSSDDDDDEDDDDELAESSFITLR